MWLVDDLWKLSTGMLNVLEGNPGVIYGIIGNFSVYIELFRVLDFFFWVENS